MDPLHVQHAWGLAAGWIEGTEMRRYGARTRLAILKLAVRLLEVAVAALPPLQEDEGADGS
jgi:hypothetical protein